jgi:hypothetical protein
MREEDRSICTYSQAQLARGWPFSGRLASYYLKLKNKGFVKIQEPEF